MFTSLIKTGTATYLKRKRERNINGYSFLKGNYTLHKMGKNKLIVVHHQAGCGMPRAARAGKQPATVMAELQDEDRTETEKDTTANN